MSRVTLFFLDELKRRGIGALFDDQKQQIYNIFEEIEQLKSTVFTGSLT